MPGAQRYRDSKSRRQSYLQRTHDTLDYEQFNASDADGEFHSDEEDDAAIPLGNLSVLQPLLVDNASMASADGTVKINGGGKAAIDGEHATEGFAHHAEAVWQSGQAYGPRGKSYIVSIRDSGMATVWRVGRNIWVLKVFLKLGRALAEPHI
ncbi:MAG: hypothetical protein MMC23_002377 [Stictis urceolatum]|nr:hypothetical protein [Stictis urceolata]